MLGTKTFLQHVIEDEKEEFISENKIAYNSISEKLERSSGAFLFEVNSTSKAFQDLLNSGHREEVAEYLTTSPKIYMDQLGTRLIKVAVSQPTSTLLQEVYDIKQKLGKTFAGALFLTSEKGIINPLHPLVALELLNDLSFTVKKLLIFTYDNLKEIDSKYGLRKKDFTSDISLLIKAYQSQVQDRAIRVVNNDFQESSDTIRQDYQISKLPGEDQNKEYFMVAHQLLTRGTFVPYYGTSIISMNGNTTGIHITPFKSCNISNHNNTDGASVCTGNTSNKTIEGLRTLHHANLSSPYQSNCMTDASKPYADACIEYSLNIFKQAKLVKEEIPNEQKTTEQSETKE
jgi:hypothetical protein